MTQPSDKRLSFNQDPDSYHRIRPSYPAALFDALFEKLPEQPQIVEVGPGTGQATKDLLARGASVHAVEIGPAMAAKLKANLTSDQLTVGVGDFELLEFEPGSADAVFSATAYHWISPASQTERPATILRPGGILAVVDSIQVNSPDDHGFFAASQAIYQRYGQGHTGPPAPSRDNIDPVIRSVMEADDRFGPVEVRRFDWNQTYSAAGYRDLMLSYSTTQMMAATDRDGLLDDIEAFIRSDFEGVVTRPLVVTLTAAVKDRS